MLPIGKMILTSFSFLENLRLLLELIRQWQRIQNLRPVPLSFDRELALHINPTLRRMTAWTSTSGRWSKAKDVVSLMPLA